MGTAELGRGAFSRETGAARAGDRARAPPGGGALMVGSSSAYDGGTFGKAPRWLDGGVLPLARRLNEGSAEPRAAADAGGLELEAGAAEARGEAARGARGEAARPRGDRARACCPRWLVGAGDAERWAAGLGEDWRWLAAAGGWFWIWTRPWSTTGFICASVGSQYCVCIRTSAFKPLGSSGT